MLLPPLLLSLPLSLPLPSLPSPLLLPSLPLPPLATAKSLHCFPAIAPVVAVSEMLPSQPLLLSHHRHYGYHCRPRYCKKPSLPSVQALLPLQRFLLWQGPVQSIVAVAATFAAINAIPSLPTTVIAAVSAVAVTIFAARHPCCCCCCRCFHLCRPCPQRHCHRC
jgi:hypothetical protein